MLYRCVLCDAVAPKSEGRLPEDEFNCKHEFAPVTEPHPATANEKETDAEGDADDDEADGWDKSEEDTDLYKETGDTVG